MLHHNPAVVSVSSRNHKEAAVDASGLLAQRDAFMARHTAGARDPGLWRDCRSDKRAAGNIPTERRVASTDAGRAEHAERRVRFSDEGADETRPLPKPDAPCGAWVWILLVAAIFACVIALAVAQARPPPRCSE